MEHSYIEENNIADLYLMGKLSEQDRALFELHFIDCQQCIELLETTQDLREGLQTIEPIRTRQARPAPVAGLPGPLVQLFPWRRAIIAAAALLLITVLPALFFIKEINRLRAELEQAKAASVAAPDQRQEVAEKNPVSNEGQASATPNQNASEVIRQKHPVKNAQARQRQNAEPTGGANNRQLAQVNTPIFALAAERGGEPTPSVPLNKLIIERSHQWFVISLELDGPLQYKSYRASIFDNANRLKWQANNLQPNMFDALTIGFKSNFFLPGDYHLKLEGLQDERAATTVAEYLFTVITK